MAFCFIALHTSSPITQQVESSAAYFLLLQTPAPYRQSRHHTDTASCRTINAKLCQPTIFNYHILKSYEKYPLQFTLDFHIKSKSDYENLKQLNTGISPFIIYHDFLHYITHQSPNWQTDTNHINKIATHSRDKIFCDIFIRNIAKAIEQ